MQTDQKNNQGEKLFLRHLTWRLELRYSEKSFDF